MKLRTAQAWLVSLLLAGLVISIAALYTGYIAKQYFAEDFQSLLLQALAQFSGPLSVVIGSYFALRQIAKRAHVDQTTFWLAVACVVLWSLLIGGRTIAFVASTDEPLTVLSNWFSHVGTATTFLLTAALSYFFATPKL